MYRYAIEFHSVKEELPKDEEIKIVITESKSGRITWNRAWFDGQFWHGSGSMAGVTFWGSLDPADCERTLRFQTRERR